METNCEFANCVIVSDFCAIRCDVIVVVIAVDDKRREVQTLS